jgi:purine-binding chemotaxis protein CheW
MSAIAASSDCAASDPDRGGATVSARGAGGPGTEVLVFEVAGQKYALPTRDVRELVRAVAITRLPDAPAVIEGVVNVRGCVFPVLDVRARFGLPSRALDVSDHFIVASAGSRGVILRVDRATHLAFVDEKCVQPSESLGASRAHVAGVAKMEGGLVLIHDVATFLSAAEATSLDAALAPEVSRG